MDQSLIVSAAEGAASDQRNFDDVSVGIGGHGHAEDDQSQSMISASTEYPEELELSMDTIFQRLACRASGCECQAFVAPSTSATSETATDLSGDNSDKIGEQRMDDPNSNPRSSSSAFLRNCTETKRLCSTCRHAYILHVLSPRHNHDYDVDASARRLDWWRIVELASLILYESQAVPVRLKIILDHCLASRKNHQRTLHQNRDEIDLLTVFGWSPEDYRRGYVIQNRGGEPLDRWSMCSVSEEEAILDEFSRFALTRTIALNLMVASNCKAKEEYRDRDANGELSSANGRSEGEQNMAAGNYHIATSFTPALLEGLALRVWSRSAPDGLLSQLPFHSLHQPGFGQAGSPSSQVSPSSFSTSSSSMSYRPKTENGRYESIPLSGGTHGRSASANDYIAPSLKPPSNAHSDSGTSQSSLLPPPQDEAEDLTVVAARSSPNSAPVTSYDDSDPRKIRRSSIRKNGQSLNGSMKRLNQSAAALRQKNQALGRTMLHQLGTNPVTGKKRVQCMVCLGTFCDKGALKIHFSAVHLKEMHKCTREGCDMVFSSRRSRNRHSANSNPKLHTSSVNMAFGGSVRARGGGGVRAHNILSPTAASLGFRVVSPPAAAEEYERMMAEFRKGEKEKLRAHNAASMDTGESNDSSQRAADQKSPEPDSNDDSRVSTPLTPMDEGHDMETDDDEKQPITEGNERSLDEQDEASRHDQSSPSLSMAIKEEVNSSSVFAAVTARLGGVRKRKSDRPIRLQTAAYENDQKEEKTIEPMNDRGEEFDLVETAEDDGCACEKADDDCEPLDFSRSTNQVTSVVQPMVAAGVDSIFVNNLASFMPNSLMHRAAAALAFSSSAASLQPSMIFGQASDHFDQNATAAIGNKKKDGTIAEETSRKEIATAGVIGMGSASAGTDPSSRLASPFLPSVMPNHPLGFGLLIPNNVPISRPQSVKKASSPEPTSSTGEAFGQRISVPVPINEKNHRQCTLCLKIFQNQFSVKTHYQNVHMKIQHKCTVSGCNAQFPSKRSRDRHSQNQNLHRKLLSCSRGPTPVPPTTPIPPQPPIKKSAPTSVSTAFPTTASDFGITSNGSLFGGASAGFISPPTAPPPAVFPPSAFFNQLVAALATYGKVPPGGAPMVPAFPLPFVPVMPESVPHRKSSPEAETSSDQELSEKKDGMKKARKHESSKNRRFSATKQQPYPPMPSFPGFPNGTNGETKTTA